MIILAVSLWTLIIIEKDSPSTKKSSSRLDTNWLIKENSAGTFHAKQCSIRILSHTDGVGDGSSPCRVSLFRRTSGRRRGRHIRRLLHRAHFHIVEKCGDTTRMTYPTRWVTDGADAVVKASVRDILETTAYNHDSPGEDRDNLARQTRFFWDIPLWDWLRPHRNLMSSYGTGFVMYLAPCGSLFWHYLNFH